MKIRHEKEVHNRYRHCGHSHRRGSRHPSFPGACRLDNQDIRHPITSFRRRIRRANRWRASLEISGWFHRRRIRHSRVRLVSAVSKAGRKWETHSPDLPRESSRRHELYRRSFWNCHPSRPLKTEKPASTLAGQGWLFRGLVLFHQGAFMFPLP